MSGRPPLSPEAASLPEAASATHLEVVDACEGELDHVDLSMPLQRFVCLAGRCGSGSASSWRTKRRTAAESTPCTASTAA